MGFRIEAPKQDGNARFNTLKVNLNENNSATRTVVSDEEGNFYYGAGGGGGTGGTNGSSGTSGANGSSGTSGANGTSGTSGANGSSGSSGISGTGFNTIADALQGRVLLSDGSTNSASASANLFYDTGSSTFQITGSLIITGSITGSTDIFIRSSTSEPITIGRAYYSASNGNNLVFGHGTLRSGSTGTNRNIAIGDYTLGTLQSGIENVAIGYAALFRATNNRNTAVGAYALFNTTGSTGFRNNAFGAYALAFNTTGEVNNAFGSYALYRNTVDDYNAAFADFALYNLSTGSSNSALGQAAGYNLRSGEGNVIIGRGAAPSLLSGSNNTIIGAITPNADINTPIFGLTTGSYNTIIGSNIKGLPSILDSNIIIADGNGNIRASHNAISWSFSGSVVAPQGFTGSLFGTSSWAVSASWAPVQATVDTASFVSSSNVFGPYGFNSIQTASYALTASSADDFTVRGTLTAQTIVAQVITSSTEYITGSTIFGSELSNTHEFTGSVSITGSLKVNNSLVVLSNQTGSMSVATSSYAFTASYVDASNVNNLFRIATGSVSASVNVTPQSLFLINSGFTQYFNISSSGDVDIYSNLFIVRNFNTQQPVLTISQSIVQIATQSFDPTGITQAGSIWFTSASMFVGLE